jgi:polar amino acid transport system substrate-binding protein
MALLVAGCGGGSSSSSSGLSSDEAGAETGSSKVPKSIADSGTMSLCADLTFPPMTYEDASGKPVGFDIETAEAVAGLWGVDLKVQNMPFEGVLPALSTGRCDFAWTGINITEERLETFEAVPYMKTAEVLIVPAGNPNEVKEPKDIGGSTVATEGGTIYAKQLESIAKELKAAGETPPNIQTYPKMSEAIQQIVVGRAEAVLTQDTEAAYRSIQEEGSFETAYTFPEALEFGVYFQQGEPEVKADLEAALKKLAAAGTLDEIAEKNGLSTKNLVIG